MQNQLRGEVYIGENITLIGRQAFERTNASSLVFARSRSVPGVGFGHDRGFLGSGDVYNRTFNHTTGAILDQQAFPNFEIGIGAFANNYRLGGTVALPSTTTRIGAQAFIENIALMQVQLATGPTQPRLRHIGVSAFEEARNLAQIFTIPSSVAEIGDFAFALTNINNFVTENTRDTLTGGAFPTGSYHRSTPLARDGIAYLAIDGHLIRHLEDDSTHAMGIYELAVYAPGRTDGTFHLRSLTGQTAAGRAYAVINIGDYAFAEHRHLANIWIPEYIGLCPAGIRIIDDTLPFVGHGIFSNARSLRNVYIGTQHPHDFFNKVLDRNPFEGLPFATAIRLVSIGGSIGGIHAAPEADRRGPEFSDFIVMWWEEFFEIRAQITPNPT
jgi:hypothetical protein